MTDWQPLCGDDPVPGSSVTVKDYGDELVATGELIATQVEVLRRLADPGQWEAQSANAFRDQAEDLAKEIAKVEGRYREVGGLVQGWAGALEEAKRAAGDLREQAQAQQRIVLANPEAGPEPVAADAPAGTQPEVSESGQAQNGRRQRALEEIEDLKGRLSSLKEGLEDEGSTTGERIRGALDDGMNDGWRDRLKAWIADHVDVLREIAKWAGRIAAVIGLIALFISPLGWVAFAAALVAVVASGLLAYSGDGSWFDFGLNVVGALTFGVGAVMTRGVTSAFRGARVVFATRAGASSRAAVLNAADGPLVSLTGRIPGLGAAFRGVQGATRAVRAPLAGGLSYVTTRFAPLVNPSVRQFLSYNGRRLAAIRNEAATWVARGGDELIPFADDVARATRFLPPFSLLGVGANGYAVTIDEDVLPELRPPGTG